MKSTVKGYKSGRKRHSKAHLKAKAARRCWCKNQVQANRLADLSERIETSVLKTTAASATASSAM